MKHLQQSDRIRDQRRLDIEAARINPELECIDMDFEKVLSIPRLTSGPCYYLRGLNISNFGIQPSSGPGKYCSYIFPPSVFMHFIGLSISSTLNLL